MRTAIINFSTGGSTGRIAYSLHHAFEMDGILSYFCYGCYLQNEPKPPINSYKIGNFFVDRIHFLFTRIFGLQGFFSISTTLAFLFFLYKKKIDTLILLNIHANYLNEWLLFKYIKLFESKVVYLMIDEYPWLGRCCYSMGCNRFMSGCGNCPHLDVYPKCKFDFSRLNFKMKEASYRNLRNSIFVAPLCAINSAKESYLLKGKNFKVLDEPIDVMLFSPRENSITKQKLGLPSDKIIILCAAPMKDPRKGCKYYLEAAKTLANKEEILFVHVGCDIDYPDLPANYIAVPFISDLNLLADYMSCADLFVFPSLADSMPSACTDALSCGTPLLVFDIPGITVVGDETVLTAVPQGCINSLVNVILATKHKTPETIKICRQYALSRFDSRVYNRTIINMIHDLEDKSFNN